ncbi:MAG TPA: dihydrofolate reductase family protein [Actinomycetota bacterium]|nr:dihydrofolate reductase family protein [Actinomycetota bacterium]
MRTLAVHMQTTLNNRIANADGVFWEPFPWGEEEMTWLNQRFRAADTWALGRRTYEAIVPWWDQVAAGEVPDDAPGITAADREFAALLRSMTKVVFSRTLEPTSDRVVVAGDIAGELAALKRRDGKAILLSCGPATLAPLAATPGLVVHPAVIGAGPQLFEQVATDLALRLVEAKVFDAGAVVLRYAVAPP